MSHTFAVKWLKAFRTSAEAVVALYADDFLFEDPILGQRITSREELLRVFAPYANKDTENGIGINNFRIDEVVGDKNAAIYRWTWHAPTAAAFVGVPTQGAVPGARGITFHIYDTTVASSGKRASGMSRLRSAISVCPSTRQLWPRPRPSSERNSDEP